MNIRCIGELRCVSCDIALSAFFGKRNPTNKVAKVLFEIENTWIAHRRNKDNYIKILKIDNIELENAKPYRVQTAHTNSYETAANGIQELHLNLGLDLFKITNVHRI